MELFRNSVENERTLKNLIQEVPNSVDITFRDRITSDSNCNQYNVEVRTTEDSQDLAQSDINRPCTEQNGLSASLTEQRSDELTSPPEKMNVMAPLEKWRNKCFIEN
jgi:hypothetical protein